MEGKRGGRGIKGIERKDRRGPPTLIPHTHTRACSGRPCTTELQIGMSHGQPTYHLKAENLAYV